MDSDNEFADVEFSGGTNQRDNRELQNHDGNSFESTFSADQIMTEPKSDEKQTYGATSGFSSFKFDQNVAEPKVDNTQNQAPSVQILPFDENMSESEFDDKQDHIVSIGHSPFDQSMAQPTDDRFKAEALIKLEIKNFKNFVDNAKCCPVYNHDCLYSDPVYIRGMSWKIFVDLRNYGKEIGLFLQCDSNNPDDHKWSCAALAELRLCSVHDDSKSYKRQIESHTYNQKGNDFGYKGFCKVSDLFDAKDNFIKDDTVCFEAFVRADVPHSANWNSKDQTGYNGLENQGATCYMNSILQMFFFTNKLRNAVYFMPTEKDQAESSVALEMQRVFYELQHSQKAVDTRKLTKSFGWNSYESFQQHDVQEFCRILMDNLESKMAKTPIEDTIPQLFKGQMRSYISCIKVKYESSRDESFYDVQLNVKGKLGVIESLRGYVEPEILEGDNLYDAGKDFGMQEAKKGVKFIAFPPVLHLQLMRFQYNPETDANEKVDDRFEFTDVLDLNEFIEGSNGEYVYCLQAVLVHSGSTRGGHYIVYINTDLHSATPKWCKFDDDFVSHCSPSEAIEANFGESSTFSWRNAYMLVYIRKDKIKDVLCPIEIPQELRDRFENEAKEELKEKQQRELAERCYKVTLVTDNDLRKDHFVYDVGDFEAFKNEQFDNTIWVPKNAKALDFYKLVSEKFNLPVDQFRLWRYDSVNYSSDNLQIHQPHKLISRESKSSHWSKFTDNLFHAYDDNVFYVENESSEISSELDENEEILIFFKFYNAESKSFMYLGSLVIELNAPFGSYSPLIKPMIGLQDDVRLAFYLVSSSDIQSIGNEQPLDSLNVPISNGSIVIAEAASNLSTENHFKMALKQACEQIKIEAIPNVEKFATSTDPFTFDLQLSTTLAELCELIGKRLNCDSNMIVIWKLHWYEDKPTDEMYSFEELPYRTINDVFFSGYNSTYDPRNKQARLIHYSKIPVSIEQFQNYWRLRITLLFYNHQAKEAVLFVPENCQAKDVLEAARQHFDFDPNGTKKLRLVECKSNKIIDLAFDVVDEDRTFVNDSLRRLALRIEETPHDQLTLASNETLIPVCHYDNRPLNLFGVGFFVKAVDKEHFDEVKKRIKQTLNVSEQEFEKFKFNLFTKEDIISLDEDEKHVDLEWLKGMKENHFPYIGIDHVNKKQKNKFSSRQKSIVIHN